MGMVGSIIIGIQNKDSIGNPLSAITTNLFGRLRKWGGRSQTKNSADRSLRNAFQELDRVQSNLGLSDAVIEKASFFTEKHRRRILFVEEL